MSNIELGSSSDEGGDYRTTAVTLGYVSADPTTDDISHVGGYPTWLDQSIRPPATLAKCKVCNGLTSLLLQLNADLQQHFPNDDRRLHVLCCRKRACSRKLGSIRTFREVRKPQIRAQEKTSEPVATKDNTQSPKHDLGKTIFRNSTSPPPSSKINPFSLKNPTLSQPENPFSSLPPVSSLAAKIPQPSAEDSEPPTTTFADKLRINSPSPPEQPRPEEIWPPQSDFPQPFTYYHLDADAEELDPEPVASALPGGPSKSKYDVDDSGGNGTEKDNFESSLDKTFQKFSDRIAQNPEQVLRYEYKGQPLLYSGTDATAARFIVPHGKAGAVRGMPRCESCGAQRVFELQLVPGLIYELEKDEVMDLDEGMDWGTIIVGTCANNCGEPGTVSYREEWVGVQWEEIIAKR